MREATTDSLERAGTKYNLVSNSRGGWMKLLSSAPRGSIADFRDRNVRNGAKHPVLYNLSLFEKNAIKKMIISVCKIQNSLHFFSENFVIKMKIKRKNMNALKGKELSLNFEILGLKKGYGIQDFRSRGRFD